MRLCKAKVAEYTNSHMDVTDRQQVTVHDVYVVWSCKTLQNNKALLSTMRLISFRSGDLKSHTMIKFAPAQIGGKDNENCSN